MFDLSGKTALITGASGGIGGAIARALHHQGAHVALAGTRTTALDTLARDLGDRAHPLAADLADPAAADTLVRDAEAAMGHLDILVNNAGIGPNDVAGFVIAQLIGAAAAAVVMPWLLAAAPSE